MKDEPASSRTEAEKPAASRTVTFFAERRTRADFAVFDRIMGRAGDKKPREEDMVILTHL